MHDAHVGNIGDARHVVRAQAEIIVLEIKEVARIEASKRFEHVRSKQHETTADDRRFPNDVPLVDPITHLIPRKTRAEWLSQTNRQETAHKKIEDSRNTSTKILNVPVLACNERGQQAESGMTVEEVKRTRQRIVIEIDIRIQDEVIPAVDLIDCKIVPASIADIAVS